MQSIKVKVIHNNGPTALVEYFTGKSPSRCFIPVESIVDDAVDANILEAGIPFGIDWEKAFVRQANMPKLVSDTLRNGGIWTADELMQNPQQVIGILQNCYGVDFSRLIQYANTKK